MNQIAQFISNHPLLAAAIVVVMIALIIIELKASIGSKVQVSPMQATTLINHANALVIDLRDKEVFRKGHIIDAKNSPEIVNDKKHKLLTDKDKTFIFVCDNGIKASTFAEQLIKEGYKSAYALKGGIRTWLEEDMPLVH